MCVSDRWFKLVQVATRLLLGLVLEFSVGTQGIVKYISIMKSVFMLFKVKILEVGKDILKTQFILSSTKSEIIISGIYEPLLYPTCFTLFHSYLQHDV